MLKKTHCPARTVFPFLCKHNSYRKHTAADTEAGEKHRGNKEVRLFRAQAGTTGPPRCGTPTQLLGGMCVGSSKGSSVFKGETNFNYIVRDPALTLFPKHKFTPYKQMTIKHLYTTNIRAASYGTHSHEEISQGSPATKEKLPKSNVLSNNGERRTSLCINLALGQTRQGMATERHRVKGNIKQWRFREDTSPKTDNWAHM